MSRMPLDPSSLRRLDGTSSTLVFDVAEGPPVLLYWGPPLVADTDLESLRTVRQRPVPHGMLDDEEPLNWLPEPGRGATFHPGLKIHRGGRDFITQLRPCDFKPIKNGFEITLIDELVYLEATVSIAFAGDVLESRVKVTDTRGSDASEADTPLTLSWLAAGSVHIPSECSEVLHFDGRWCREFQTVRQALPAGQLVRENRVGRTSHHSFPGLLLGTPGFDPVTGEVFGLHLGWSGNHRVLAERTRDGRVQVQMGELLEAQEIQLLPGESYTSPPLYAARSSHGTNALSEVFHGFVRNQLLPKNVRAKQRPVHFNTWEILYFDHTEARVLELVQDAALAGAERFVLDDGWFRGRRDDSAGLGDWDVCTSKYPQGLEPVVTAVHAAGMEMGLWIEPEMINEDSDLCRAHPEWVLRVPERTQPLGRNQYALDLNRSDVQQHLLKVLVALIDRYQLGYLKWDMNRDLCHVQEHGRPAQHRMTSSYYSLVDQVRDQRPDVEIEACSSGGGRIDYEIIRRSERVWLSDSHDPKERQLIQEGFNLFFPPEIMGSHVGSKISETSGRRHSLAFRAHTALFGHFGLEPTREPLDPEEQELLERAVALHKAHREWLHSCRTLYLPHPEPNLCARLALSRDGATGVLSAALLDTSESAVLPPLRILGLSGATRYGVQLLEPQLHQFAKSRSGFHRGDPIVTTGEILGQGLQLPPLRPDSIALILLQRSSS